MYRKQFGGQSAFPTFSFEGYGQSSLSKMLTKSGIDDNLTKKPLTLYGQDYDCADEIADKLALAKENTATDNLNEEEREEME